MRKEFLINIVFLIGINLLIKPFYVLVVETSVQNTVGPNAFGKFFAIFNLCLLTQIILDLGLQNYTSRWIAQNQDKINGFLPKVLGIKLSLSIVFILFVFCVAWLISFPGSYFYLLGIVAFNIVCLSFVNYIRVCLGALGHYRLDSLISLIDKLILIIILCYFLWFSGDRSAFSIETFVFSQSASIVLTLLSSILILYSKVKWQSPIFALEFSRSLLLKSAPYALVIILMYAYSRMDGVMLDRMLEDDSYQAGLYAAVYRLLEAMNVVGFLFAGLLLPMFSKLLKQSSELQELLSLSFKLLFAISAIASVCIYFNGQSIVDLLYPDHSNPQYGTALKVLILSYIPLSLIYVFGTFITATGKLKAMNNCFVVGILINFVLNFMLIPEQGAIGAAWATFFTQTFVFLAQLILTRKYLVDLASDGVDSFKNLKTFILVPLLFLILTVLINVLLQLYLDLHWSIIALIGIILAIILSLGLKLVDLRGILDRADQFKQDKKTNETT